jgi:hypothetical protein
MTPEKQSEFFRFETSTLHSHECLPDQLMPGDMYVANHDSVGVSETPIFLLPGSSCVFDIETSIDISDIPKNSILGISLRSGLAQSGLDIDETSISPINSNGKLTMRTKIGNHSLNTYYAQPEKNAPVRLKIGRLYMRHPTPIEGDELKKEIEQFHTLGKPIETNFINDLSVHESVLLPVTNTIRQTQIPPALNLVDLPRGSKREKLHKVLNVSSSHDIKPTTEYLDTPITMIETASMRLSDNTYLFVIGAIEDLEMDNSNTIFHTSSTLLYDNIPGDDRPMHTRIGEIYKNGHRIPEDVSKMKIVCLAYHYHSFE